MHDYFTCSKLTPKSHLHEVSQTSCTFVLRFSREYYFHLFSYRIKSTICILRRALLVVFASVITTCIKPIAAFKKIVKAERMEPVTSVRLGTNLVTSDRRLRGGEWV